MPVAAREAQLEAAAARVACPAAALHCPCHLAPFGMQSFDQSVYMHSNGAFAALLFINHFEYTLNETFARDVTYPLLDGINAWWTSYLNLSSSGEYHDDNSHNRDAQHEGQLVADPQISLSLLARTMSAQLTLAAALGIAPPPAVADVAARLTPFNTAPFNFTPPAAENFTYWNNTRCHNDAGVRCGLALADCEAACAALGVDACSWFTFCPGNAVATCDACGAAPACWHYAAPVSQCGPGPGFTSGEAMGGRAPPQRLTAWASYRGADVARDSDSFALYPAWPSDWLNSQRGGGGGGTDSFAVAQASARAYIDWAGGRTVDVFSSAVLAGYGGPAPAAGNASFLPADVLDGFEAQVASLFGQNLLLRAPGGGIENIGASRAINDMLLGAVPLPSGAAPPQPLAPPPWLLRLFPFWPAGEPAAFTSLLAKGGFLVTARYDNASRAVVSPVQITAAYTLAGAAAAVVHVQSPWPHAPPDAVSATCGGAPAPVTWPAEYDGVLAFPAPRGLACELALAAPVAPPHPAPARAQ